MPRTFALAPHLTQNEPLATESGQQEIVDAINNIDLNLEGIKGFWGDKAASYFGEDTSVAGNTTVTLVTHTVPALQDMILRGVVAEADCDFLFWIEKNGSKIWQSRNAWTQRDVVANISVASTAGDVFELKAKNLKGNTASISGALYTNDDV